MPGIHGVDIMRLPGPRPQYPVIAMTGHVDAEAQEEFRYVARCQWGGRCAECIHTCVQTRTGSHRCVGTRMHWRLQARMRRHFSSHGGVRNAHPHIPTSAHCLRPCGFRLSGAYPLSAAAPVLSVYCAPWNLQVCGLLWLSWQALFCGGPGRRHSAVLRFGAGSLGDAGGGQCCAGPWGATVVLYVGGRRALAHAH
jgi:hypothetical protein